SAFVRSAYVGSASAGTWVFYPLYFQGVSSLWRRLEKNAPQSRAASKLALDLPLMRGTKEVYEAAKLPGSLGQKTGRIAASFVPAPVADVGTLSDEYQRETETGLKGFRKIGLEFGREVAARLPMARNLLPPKMDVFGEPIMTEKGVVIDP
ncbi:MAG: hypothetical protein ACREA2_14490, partial [Blastocatellia bacterium]